MKKLRIFAITALISAFSFTSCESFFDVDLEYQPKIEDIFTRPKEVQKYLSHLYSYIPMEEEMVNNHGWSVGRSDEALFSWYQWVNYVQYRTGNYSSATSAYNYWPTYYVGINECSTFLKYLPLNTSESDDANKWMAAEARFLRAYYYFLLFRQYGPVYVWGDQLSDEKIDPKSVDRHTVEQNIKFMLDELDAIKNDLPISINQEEKQWVGRATRGAALALKSRITLYAASPLYNGCDLYVGKMKNIRGEYLFPQTPNQDKWEEAAQAAKDVIDLAETGLYKLYEDETQTDRMKKGIASFQGVRMKNWNSETIWGWWCRSGSYNWLGEAGGLLACAMPGIPSVVYQGYGGIQPSLKLVDSYPMMTTGRYPVTGYEAQNDYSRPIIDPASGYVSEGFTDGYKQPDAKEDFAAVKAHNSCVGRDPRYYACIVPNGFMWPNKTENIKFTCYNNDECTCKWAPGEGGGITRVGYVWRRLYETNKSLRTGADYTTMKLAYPAFRLAEIYLNYAEACNEKPQRDETAALTYINKVRNRVGLNNIEVAYPEITGNKELLRWCIQKERMVEFGLEAMRHYDACRWMIAKKEYPAQNWTLHVGATTYEESYQRVSTDYVGSPAVFSDKDYLHPIYMNQMAEMSNMTQNYGH